MKNHTKRTVFSLSSFFFVSLLADTASIQQLPTSTEAVRIGKVNMLEVMWSTDEGQALKISLENMQKEKAQELERKSQELAQSFNDYRARATALNDTAREKEEKKLTKMQRELEQAKGEAQEELESHMQKATMQMAQRVDKKIVEIGKRYNCDLIQCEATQKVWTINTTSNLTNAVREELNSEHRQMLAQNAQKITPPLPSQPINNKPLQVAGKSALPAAAAA